MHIFEFLLTESFTFWCTNTFTNQYMPRAFTYETVWQSFNHHIQTFSKLENWQGISKKTNGPLCQNQPSNNLGHYIIEQMYHDDNCPVYGTSYAWLFITVVLAWILCTSWVLLSLYLVPAYDITGICLVLFRNKVRNSTFRRQCKLNGLFRESRFCIIPLG